MGVANLQIRGMRWGDCDRGKGCRWSVRWWNGGEADGGISQCEVKRGRSFKSAAKRKMRRHRKTFHFISSSPHPSPISAALGQHLWHDVLQNKTIYSNVPSIEVWWHSIRINVKIQAVLKADLWGLNIICISMKVEQ